MVIAWAKELETGIKEIDDQHKEIIFHLGRIVANCCNSTDKNEIANSMQKFIEFIENHLATEEKYMQIYDYEDYDVHSSIHTILKIGFAEMNERYNIKGATSKYVHQICRVFANWIIWHINNEDRKLAEFLTVKTANKKSNEV